MGKRRLPMEDDNCRSVVREPIKCCSQKSRATLTVTLGAVALSSRASLPTWSEWSPQF
jgi:hypothetical protein